MVPLLYEVIPNSDECHITCRRCYELNKTPKEFYKYKSIVRYFSFPCCMRKKTYYVCEHYHTFYF